MGAVLPLLDVLLGCRWVVGTPPSPCRRLLELDFQQRPLELQEQGGLLPLRRTSRPMWRLMSLWRPSL